MPAHDTDTYRDPLDLLRRFVPTPLQTSVSLAGARVVVETNDLGFFPAPGSGTAGDSQQPQCLWKVVRDFDSHQKPTEASIVMAGSLVVYSLGPACMIAADRERQEILAFIGVAIDALMFEGAVYPALIRLTEFVTRPPESATANTSAGVAVGDARDA